jgi:hypothetical protein
VQEAIACGLPVITTEGGATDEFCSEGVAWRIPARRIEDKYPESGEPRCFLESEFEALLAQMTAIADGKRPQGGGPARPQILQAFTWDQTAALLARHTAGVKVAVAAPDGRPQIRSFAVFDTLIARRCGAPWQIFARVAEAAGQPWFLPARLAAALELEGQEAGLDEIYRQLASTMGLSPAAAEALKADELAAELEHVIPVAETLHDLRDGDVLVAETHLPEAVVRQMLEKAGLAAEVGLVMSAAPTPAQGFLIERHVEGSAVCAPEPVEQWLAAEGLEGLGLLAREMRLRSWHPDPPLRAVQKAQAQLNFPILLLASVALLRVAETQGRERLLFCCRDGNLWLDLVRAVQASGVGGAFETAYFYTSRISRMRVSADYLAHARTLLGRRGLVVDSCGTGWSLAHLFDRLDLAGQHGFYIQKLDKLNIYEETAPTPDNGTVHLAMEPARPLSHIAIEMLNTAAHGSVQDVRLVAGSALPVFGRGWRGARGCVRRWRCGGRCSPPGDRRWDGMICARFLRCRRRGFQR